MKISPSILAANLLDLKRIFNEMDPAQVDLIHLDVMDGHFVPTLSFGEPLVKLVKKSTDIPLDVHLMVTNPEQEVPKYFELEPYNITFHLEATSFGIRLAQSIRAEGIKAGVAINPATSHELLKPLLEHIDLILVMSVEPGFYGQKFIESTYSKLADLKELTRGSDLIIELDGGVSVDNIRKVREHGVDICVAGSACFKTDDVNGNVTALKTAAG